MKRIIYIRHSPKWESMTEQKFIEQEFPNSQEWWDKALPNIFPQVKWWNSLCSISYFEYRKKVTDITLRNISKTNPSIVLSKKIEIQNDKFIFLPTDDDDWYHPKIFEILEKHIESDLIIWKNFINKEYRNPTRIFTNNYALTHNGKQKLKDKGLIPSNILFGDFPEMFDVLQSKYIKTSKINECLSVTNRTLASATILSNYKKKSEFVSQLMEVKKNKIEAPTWALEEVEMMNDLNESVKLLSFL